MTSRDRVLCTLNHEAVDRAPRDLWVSPPVEAARADEVAEIEFRYPRDIVRPDFRPPKGHRAKGNSHEPGEFTDAWGCVWHVQERCGPAHLAASPLADPGLVGRYHLPWELIEKANLAAVNRGCRATSRFVLARSDVRPFERLEALHGRDATLAGLAAGAASVRALLDMVHDFFCREMEMWAATEVDGVALGDDWGSPQGLPIAPQAWRELFRPLYREYCEILRGKDKYVFFQSGGEASEVVEDLVAIGVDAVRMPLHLAHFDRLAETYRNRVTFWGGTDESGVLAGRPEDLRNTVRKVRAALDYGRGGIIAQCHWTPAVSFNNVAAFFEAHLAPIPMHARK